MRLSVTFPNNNDITQIKRKQQIYIYKDIACPLPVGKIVAI